jgi:hypothetical protein
MLINTEMAIVGIIKGNTLKLETKLSLIAKQ